MKIDQWTKPDVHISGEAPSPDTETPGKLFNYIAAFIMRKIQWEFGYVKGCLLESSGNNIFTRQETHKDA